jgi:hypothetical protein
MSRDEPTVILAAQAYADAYRAVLALKRAGRCIREREYEDEAPCWRFPIDAEDVCANCKARDEIAYRVARSRMRNAKRKLHRALGVYLPAPPAVTGDVCAEQE